MTAIDSLNRKALYLYIVLKLMMEKFMALIGLIRGATKSSLAP